MAVNAPHCFHSYEMWELWTRLLHPSGGHERTPGGDRLPALHLPKHRH
uniref:Selenium-binding protein 1 (Predicted) n=1 Tax=Callithrix jacchus TaxID=9483 RepID=B0KWC5_CALJA|nr:selenium-binding protein 1 (predicted) [Callithrix jacchus]